ncbi:glycosyl transferases group 1-domain-containing protein [Diplogelasinospora grovesii]|uniref:Chitobiosyldiphosphodolichol beta-mannosyltransferase n=1 Tax=Diplogelasinospora grovesii TaxID=303347 RepID=A0AAN6N6T2_9PEZI|nr:glycosyl transferases group 1-domain-containing protein [Diplogelasinospora grovesii]
MLGSMTLLYTLSFCILALSACVAFVLFLRGPTKYRGPKAGSGGQVSAHILVLGDIGRSPRMTYHALSVAKHGGKVKLIGYLESTPHPDIVSNPNIEVIPLPIPFRLPQGKPVLFLLLAPLKVLFQVCHLARVLCYQLEPATWLLVQNPPSIPTLAIASLTCYLRNTKLTIDWHNYGWSILANTRGPTHPLVYISTHYERFFGRFGHFHLTVTEAMARQLRSPPYNIRNRLVALHDRPAAIFQPILSASTREQTLNRVFANTKEQALIPRLLDGSMRLVVSSTSWTPDEDFDLLLDALVEYASTKHTTLTAPNVTPVLVVITGKGPMEKMWFETVADLTRKGQLPHVRITSTFLPFADYAALLACADLGICLHKSTSGVDLPMKVVDMFGAGLPVAAFSGYESFSELVREGENGKGFETAPELASTLTHLLHRNGQSELDSLKKGAIKEGSRRWDEEWDSKVGVIMGFKT